jgi:hypothetical protein
MEEGFFIEESTHSCFLIRVFDLCSSCSSVGRERGQSRNSSVQTSFARGNFRLRQSGHVPSATDHRLVLGSGLAAFGEELLFHLGIKAVVDDVE